MESEVMPQENASMATYLPGVFSVDPDTLVSHETSLQVYADQDPESVLLDREFLRSLRQNCGNIIPILVLASDKRTILSGDRRRTGCKIIGVSANVQYVDPGSEPGDIDLFILNANAGHRQKLSNEQLGRLMRKMRDAYAQRTEHRKALESPVAASDADVPTSPVVASVVSVASVVEERPTSTEVDSQIAQKLGVPHVTVTAVSKVMDAIDDLKGQGKVEEARQLTEKLNKSAFKAARTLPTNKKYDKGSAAALKQIERMVRLGIKNEVANLKNVAVPNPELVTQISNGFDAIHRMIQELMQLQAESTKKKGKGEKDVATDVAPVE